MNKGYSVYISYITCYPTEKYKMNGIFEFDQAKALAAAGHKVVYALLMSGPFGDGESGALKENNWELEFMQLICQEDTKTILQNEHTEFIHII